MKYELMEVIKQYIAKKYGFEDYHEQEFALKWEDFEKFAKLFIYISENF